MQAVKEVLADSSRGATSPLVTKEEVFNAESLAVLGLEGEFYAEESNFLDKTLVGNVMFDEVIMEAVIPNAYLRTFNKTTPIVVKCVGVNGDTGKDIAICTEYGASKTVVRKPLTLIPASNQASS
jgi:hypothetical protein